MEFFKPGTQINFMKPRKYVIGATLLAIVLSIGSFFWPGPNYGIDFSGGTELELRFRGAMTVADVRGALESLGYAAPDVVNVQGEQSQFIIRVGDVTAMDEGLSQRVEAAVREALGETAVEDFNVSPGGDKITVRLSGEASPEALREAIDGAGVRTRNANAFGRPEDHRYEVHLVGVADRIIDQLQERFGDDGPEEALRIEWMGPKAGEQLRDAALKAILYAIAFIMVYVAFRFDLRFAPGGVIALLHDAIFTIGVYNFAQKEVNLTTVAAILTIIGYSINDTIVIYDRIRENMTRMRDRSLYDLINISSSETLSRTMITGSTALMTLTPFFIWGTDVLQDLSFALVVGILVGTYSSIYIAAPVTELMDTYVFRRKTGEGERARRGGKAKQKPATA